MQKVITINLNGNAYQLEETGYDGIAKYLEASRSQLGQNPDVDEIMSDLEQAIADKCTRFLSTSKNVVTAAEVEQIVEEMGPVDPKMGETEEESASASSSGPTSGGTPGGDTADATNRPRKLYRLTEDKMVGGVCSGLAAYFGTDVTIVRIIFAAVAFATAGSAAAFYVILMIVVPEARTPEEHAAAYGAPFNAREIVDQAKTRFEDFKNNKEWRRHWRAQERYWRRHTSGTVLDGVPPWVTFVLFFFAVMIGVSFLSGIMRILGSMMNPRVVGPMSTGMHPVVTIFLILIAFNVFFWILRGGRRAERRGPFEGFLESVVPLIVGVFGLWFAYTMFPGFQEFVNRLVVIVTRALP